MNYPGFGFRGRRAEFFKSKIHLVEKTVDSTLNKSFEPTVK